MSKRNRDSELDVQHRAALKKVKEAQKELSSIEKKQEMNLDSDSDDDSSTKSEGNAVDLGLDYSSSDQGKIQWVLHKKFFF